MSPSETVFGVLVWSCIALGWLGCGFIMLAIVRETVQASRSRGRREHEGESR